MSSRGVEGGTGGEFDVLFERGTRWLRNHLYSQAIEAFQRALVLAPGEERASECLCGIGAARAQLQEYAASRRYLELAHQRCPLNPHPLLRLAGLSAREDAPGRMRAFLAKGLSLGVEGFSPPDRQPLEAWLLTAPEFEKYRGMVLFLMHRHGRLATREYESRMRDWQAGRQDKPEKSFLTRSMPPGSFHVPRPPPGPPPRREPAFEETEDDRPTQGVELIRYGRFAFPARVALHQPRALRITINRQPAPDETKPVALHLFAREWPMKVVATLVNVRPEDFLVEGASSGVLEVPEDGDSQPLEFLLVPQSLGPKTIRVRFEQDNTFVTTAKVPTEVLEQVQGEPAQARVESAPALEPRGLPPDFTIYIERDAERTYSLSVCTGDGDPGAPAERMGELTFEQEGSPALYMRTRIEELDATVTREGDAARYADEVERLGNNLYEKLFIRGGLDAFYWERMYPRSEQRAGGSTEWGAPTVQIVSDEPYIPWELLRPYRHIPGRVEVDPLFFCERFALARWMDERHGSSTVDLFKVALVVPPSNLPFVQEEVDAFDRMQREGRLRVERIETREELDSFLARGGAHVVHFACHGRFEQEQPGRSLVMLGDDSLRPDDVTGRYLTFGSSRPLVFLNACDTARRGFGLTGLEGWAETFVRTARVGGFIGSTWQTTDALASRFATTFYALLSQGLSLGEAMRQARLAIKTPGDATYLSYSLYANPRARVRRAAV